MYVYYHSNQTSPLNPLGQLVFFFDSKVSNRCPLSYLLKNVFLNGSNREYKQKNKEIVTCFAFLVCIVGSTPNTFIIIVFCYEIARLVAVYNYRKIDIQLFHASAGNSAKYFPRGTDIDLAGYCPIWTNCSILTHYHGT